MSREVLLLVDALAREKNVDKDIVFGALEHALALGRQSVETLPALHDGDSELLLELADAPRKRGLRDVAGFRCTREMLLAGESCQVLELADIHARPRLPGGLQRPRMISNATDYTEGIENDGRRIGPGTKTAVAEMRPGCMLALKRNDDWGGTAMPPAASTDQTRAVRFPRDIGAGLFLLSISAFGFAGAIDLPSIWAGVGSGLMPKLTAGLIAALGLLIMSFGLSPSAEPLQRLTVRGPVFVLGSVIVFAATVRTLGLAAAGPLTWIIAALADKESRLVETIVCAALMTALCIGLFKFVLKLPIPLFPVVLGY